MAFDFDRVIDRRGTHSNKYEALPARVGVPAPQALPMWVADMEFAAPPCVLERLRAAVDHGVLGYFGGDEDWRAAICGWMDRRHGWAVQPDWITPSPGVCSALSIAIQAFSGQGEGVVIFAPVYHMFATCVRSAGRRVIESPLTLEQGRYAMDLAALDASLPADARMVLLCSPHNPGGTVWTPQELRAVADFCAARDLVLVSDEIWHDLVYDGATHTPTAVAASEATPRLVTCAAASKTFNLAGLHLAEVIIADPALCRRYRETADQTRAGGFNLLGALGAEAAYAGGDAWLDALLPYLAANRDRFADGLAQAVPGARAMPMKATYLSWVDFRGAGLDDAEVQRRLKQDARIAVNPGPSFGANGAGWARFNIGCAASVIDEALERLSDAFADLR